MVNAFVENSIAGNAIKSISMFPFHKPFNRDTAHDTLNILDTVKEKESVERQTPVIGRKRSDFPGDSEVWIEGGDV